MREETLNKGDTGATEKQLVEDHQISSLASNSLPETQIDISNHLWTFPSR